MSSTKRGGDRRNDDFYATPAWCVEEIAPKLKWHRIETVLDPCVGDALKAPWPRADLIITVSPAAAKEIDRWTNS